MESSEPLVKQLGDDLFVVIGTVGRLRDQWARASWQSEVVLEEKKLWVRRPDSFTPEFWFVSEHPDAPTTHPKPKLKALTAKRYETAEEAIQAAKEWLMEKETLARLGGS